MGLSIGKNIQSKRKEKEMTQEHLATALGVSIAAVSKWETGAAYPDITLLAPIARLLDTTVDDLLEFETQLTEEQVIEICGRCAEMFEASSCESAVNLCEKYIKEYPNSSLLKLRMGNIILMHISCAETEDAATGLIERSISLTQDAARSEDIQIREAAWQGLGALYLQQERYEDALDALEKIRRPAVDSERMKVSVYYASGDLKKAKQMAQYLLASHLAACDTALTTLAKIAKKEENYPLMLRMENLNLQLSQMFDRDKLYGQNLNHYLMIAESYAEQGKTSETLDTLREFVKCAQTPYDFESVKESPFYDNIEMSTPTVSKNYINRCVWKMVGENPKFYFLKGNSDFIGVLKELENLPE